jgi:hypothetical protein
MVTGRVAKESSRLLPVPQLNLCYQCLDFTLHQVSLWSPEGSHGPGIAYTCYSPHLIYATNAWILPYFTSGFMTIPGRVAKVSSHCCLSPNLFFCYKVSLDTALLPYISRDRGLKESAKKIVKEKERKENKKSEKGDKETIEKDRFLSLK